MKQNEQSSQVDAQSSWKWKLLPVGLTLMFLVWAAVFYWDGETQWAISSVLGAVIIVAIVIHDRIRATGT